MILEKGKKNKDRGTGERRTMGEQNCSFSAYSFDEITLLIEFE